MATALSLMEHLPVQNYDECRATLRQVRLILNEQYAPLWRDRLPIADEKIPTPDFTSARARIEYASELIRYLPVDSYQDTEELLEAFDQALAVTVGQLLEDAREQPFRLPLRIATEDGERVLPFSEDCSASPDLSALSKTA